MMPLHIKSAELEQAIQLAQEINTELTSSLKIANELKSFLVSAKWSGQTKDAFEAYLSLITQYHSDLKDIMGDHKKAVTNLKKSINQYNQSTEVSEIKGL